MTSEKKQEYTLRITSANSTALVVILYEMFFDFADEALCAVKEGRREEANLSFDKAQEALLQLIGSLNMEQDPAPAIYQVYMYVSAMMGKARGSMKAEPMEAPLRFMRSLYETYKKDSASDTSGPVMDNSQKVYAGLTYGKGTLSESMDEGSGSRGFFV